MIVKNGSHHVIVPDANIQIPVKIWADPKALDDTKLYDQIVALTQVPGAYKHVAIMPDCHYGFGMPVGGVLATDEVVVPQAVGSDIGCGISAFKTTLSRHALDEDAIDNIMNKILKRIPVGFDQHIVPIYDQYTEELDKKLVADLSNGIADSINEKPEKISKMIECQLGTLGSGNHFIELSYDENDIVWITIHSGSRGIGGKVGNYYHKQAQILCEKWRSSTPKDLPFLPMSELIGRTYFANMWICQRYAKLNRKVMMRICMDVLLHGSSPDSDIQDVYHNFANIEKHGDKNIVVHRKGATPAITGKFAIIPGSMTTKSYIVEGLSNPDSFNSCSHGSGRLFSRTEAKRRIADGIDPSQSEQLGNVKLYGALDAEDELGSAYKDVEDIISRQLDLVKVKHTLTPIAVIKGGGKNE